MQLRIPALIAVLFLSASCATTNVPDEKAETSSASIRAAEEVGATRTPAAALHLQLAKEEFEYAQHLPADKAHADRLMRRAQADAELALALARTDTDKAAAQGAIDSIKTLNASAAP
jgi:hypothetical protein